MSTVAVFMLRKSSIVDAITGAKTIVPVTIPLVHQSLGLAIPLSFSL
jgi:hypothetical protein